MASEYDRRDKIRKIAELTDPMKPQTDRISQFLNRFPVFYSGPVDYTSDQSSVDMSAVIIPVSVDISSTRGTERMSTKIYSGLSANTSSRTGGECSLNDNISTACTTERS